MSQGDDSPVTIPYSYERVRSEPARTPRRNTDSRRRSFCFKDFEQLAFERLIFFGSSFVAEGEQSLARLSVNLSWALN